MVKIRPDTRLGQRYNPCDPFQELGNPEAVQNRMVSGGRF
jgi:hypothetical protein